MDGDRDSDVSVHLPAQAESRPRRTLKRAFRLSKWAVWLSLILVLSLVFTPLGDYYGADLVQLDPLAKADYIIVLGGAKARAIEAANLYKQEWAPKIIVSSLDEDTDELAAILAANGVPSRDIIVDSRSSRTADHPEGIARLPDVSMETNSFIVVTSAYHTARAGNCFRKAGYKHVLLQSPDWERHGRFGPHDPPDWEERLTMLPRKTHEIVGIWYYRLRGWN